MAELPVEIPHQDLARRHPPEVGAAARLSLVRNKALIRQMASQLPKVAVRLASLLRVASQHRRMGRNLRLQTHRAMRCPRRKL